MLNKSLIVLAASVAVALPVAAQAGGFYAGAGIGQGKYESAEFVDCFGFCSQFSDSDFAYSLFAGYQLTDAVGVELSWRDWGEGEDTFDGEDNVSIEPTMFTLMAVGSAPIADGWSLFGKAGIAMLSLDVAVDGVGAGSEDSTDLALGGGVQWDVGGNFGVRLEGLWVDAEDSDLAMEYALSGLYKFGG